MTSILPAPTGNLSTNSGTLELDTSQTNGSGTGPQLKMEAVESKGLGRRRSRISKKEEASPTDADAEGEIVEEHSSGTEGGPPQKRRRSRKGLDKKFECSTEGCGKSYSRAEHLYRHQLNHTPKQIHNCDFPDCNRTFVRQDLCNRHRDRHTAKGSQLHRKDIMMGRGSSTTEFGKISNSPEAKIGLSNLSTSQNQFQSPQETQQHLYSNIPNVTSGPYPGLQSNGVGPFGFSKRSNSDNTPRVYDSGDNTAVRSQQRHLSFGVTEGIPPDFARPNVPPLHTELQHQGMYTSTSGDRGYTHASLQHQSEYIQQQNFVPLSLPPPTYPATSPATTRESEPQYPSSMPTDFSSDSHQTPGITMMDFEGISAPNAMPVFGGEGYNRSPFAIPEDFVAYLFNGQQLDSGNSPMVQMSQPGYANYPDTQNQYYTPNFTNHMNMGGFFPPIQRTLHPMAVTSLLDTSLPETVLSEEKSQEIVDMIKERFNETDHAPVARQKEVFLEGDRSEDSHMMSRKMMQTYIGSYWYNFSEQVPILHKPTFVPDKTPNLLLIAMMAIGASCLDKMHGYDVTQAGAELSNFLAWHLRWEIFSVAHFRPPAKLWVFQALLLLELYEKMYSTRALHERAHIHHATTITLMRRGSSLIGRSTLDSPPSVRDDRQGVNGSQQSSASGANTTDEWWNHWITNESTRRAAFAAFVIDSTHATMFGHSTVMVAHEMRLPLPCDEALWNATNSAEVGRIEASLHANGVKPISFLGGLKRTLNAQEVWTNSFGRTILMAGLLSVSWHMNQRDLQVNSLGVTAALGGRDKWRGSLTKAFDLWKMDFDKSLARTADAGPTPYGDRREDSVIFQSRTVLHHLAHMAMHVDIVDCQIFARAKRLLGRTIGTHDLNGAQRRMKDNWAPTAKARDATWYALRFLCSVLLPEESASSNIHNGFGDDSPFNYSARDDILLNRAWVMYFATLIVWSYGFALEGPCTTPISPSMAYDFDEQVRDMRAYLRRLGGVKSPEDLKSMHGFNGCVGMLMVLRTIFEKTRWELLNEGSILLGNCIGLIRPESRP